MRDDFEGAIFEGILSGGAGRGCLFGTYMPSSHAGQGKTQEHLPDYPRIERLRKKTAAA